jgi:hypothetical protein
MTDKKTKNYDTKPKKMIAKKDHVIFQNNYKIIIKKGDDLAKKDIPEHFLITLETEQII